MSPEVIHAFARSAFINCGAAWLISLAVSLIFTVTGLASAKGGKDGKALGLVALGILASIVTTFAFWASAIAAVAWLLTL